MQEDIDTALEWADWRDSLCGGCGNPRSESFDPTGPEYEATALRCRACEARAKAAHRWSEDEFADSAGLYFAVHEAHDPGE